MPIANPINILDRGIKIYSCKFFIRILWRFPKNKQKEKDPHAKGQIAISTPVIHTFTWLATCTKHNSMVGSFAHNPKHSVLRF